MMKIKGFILAIGNVQQHTDKFKSRKFVLNLSYEFNGNLYDNFGEFQLLNSQCDLINSWGVGDHVEVTFKVTGSKAVDRNSGATIYYTNLRATAITGVAQSYPVYTQPPAPEVQQQNFFAQTRDVYAGTVGSGEKVDDLPF